MGLPKHSHHELILGPEQVTAYWQEGYIIVRGVLQSFELQELSKACDELEKIAFGHENDFFEKDCFFNLHRDCDPFDKNADKIPPTKGLLRRVTYPYLVSGLINMYRAHPRILQAVSEILGNSLVQITNQINFNHPGKGHGWGWHQDYRFRKAGIDQLAESFVQTLVAVDPCSHVNGGLRIVPKSQKLGALKLDQNPETAREYFDESKAVCPRLEPGDMIIFQPYVIHGSGSNQSRYARRVFINGYAKRPHAAHGLPVLEDGHLVHNAEGTMEYEGDHVVIPRASKY